MGGNRGNVHFSQLHHPWAVRPPFVRPHPGPLSLRPMTPVQGTATGSQGNMGGGSSSVSGKALSVGPTKHPGWANLHAGGYRSSPTSPTIPSAATFIASQAVSQYGVRAPQSHRATPLVSPRFTEPKWEYDSGSPKPITAEPDYFALPASPVMGQVPHTPNGAQQDSLPPPPKPAPSSPRLRLGTNKPPRPSLARRHTHDRYSPEMLTAIERAERAGKVDSKSLGRVRVKSGLRKPTLDIGSVVGESYYAPSTKAYAHSIDRSSVGEGTGSSVDEGSRSRPATTRRSTAGTSALPTVNGSTRSFAEKRFKNRSHPSLSTIASTADFALTASTTLTNATKQRSRHGTSTVDFTQTAPSSPRLTPAPRSQHPSMDMRSLRSALRDIDQPPPAVPLTAPPTATGYIAPNTDDGYDRYTAHPAAPVPPRIDTATASSGPATPPRGAGLKHVTADTYRPPGLPKPLKEIGWNRDGPAMRTYGIAWLREGDADALPGAPAGPRWIQARPPASAATAQGGASWWESGAA